MPNGGFSAPGQRERILRGERTDPRIIIGQAVGLALVGTAIVAILIGAVMLLSIPTWRAFRQAVENGWRWMTLLLITPWLIAAGASAVVLWIELFDPNYPAPREAAQTTKVLWPWSKERVQPKQVIRARLPGSVDFSLPDDGPPVEVQE